MEPNFIQSREKRIIKVPKRDDEVYYFSPLGKKTLQPKNEKSPTKILKKKKFDHGQTPVKVGTFQKKKTPTKAKSKAAIKVRDDLSVDLQPTVSIERLSENDLRKQRFGKITKVNTVKTSNKRPAGLGVGRPKKKAKIIMDTTQRGDPLSLDLPSTSNGISNGNDIWDTSDIEIKEEPLSDGDPSFDGDVAFSASEDEKTTSKRKPPSKVKSSTKKSKSSLQKSVKGKKKTKASPKPLTPTVDKVVALPNNRMYFEFAKPKKKVILHIKPNELYSENDSQEIKSQTLDELIKSLKSRCLLSSDAEVLLESFRHLPVGLKRIAGEPNAEKPKQFSEAITVFANVLYLYAPKAFEIVNLIFHLPEKDKLQSRLRSKGYWPGFNQEAIELLKVYEPGDEVCSIMFDFVPIQKQCDLDSSANKWIGYTDFCGGLDPHNSDSLPVASEILLFTAVGLTHDWKMPFGYFPCDSLTGESLRNLVIEAMRVLQDCGLKVRALVCDGSLRTVKMAVLLGCNIHARTFGELLSGFPHPLEEKQEIHLVFGITHSLDLLRNLLSDLQVLRSTTYGAVRWDHISKLLSGKEIRQVDGNCSNSDYQQLCYLQRVSSYCQATFSSMLNRVFELIEDLQLQEYEDCEATANFVADICRAFDLLNLRNPMTTGEKPPITRPFVSEQLEAMLLIGQRLYVFEKISGGRLSYEGRWMSVTLFPFTLKAVTSLASNLLCDKHKYVTTYRLNLDHSDMILNRIQRCGGWDGLPTAAEFLRGYKTFFKSFVEESPISPYNNDYDCSDLTIGQGVICPFRRQVRIPKFNGIDFAAKSRHLIDLNMDDTAMANYVIRHVSSRLHCTECMALMLNVDNANNKNALCKYLKPSNFILKLLRISDSILRWKRIKSIKVNVEHTVICIFTECLHLLGESANFYSEHILEEPWHVISLVKVILRTFVNFRLNGAKHLLSIRSRMLEDSRKTL